MNKFEDEKKKSSSLRCDEDLLWIVLKSMSGLVIIQCIMWLLGSCSSMYMYGVAIYSSEFLGWRVFNNTVATELS